MSVVVLICGQGGDLHAILEAGIPVRAAISNRADTRELMLIERRTMPTRVASDWESASRDASTVLRMSDPAA